MTTTTDPTATLQRDFDAIALCIHAGLLQAARGDTLPPSPGSDLGFCATCGAVIEHTGDNWRHLHVADHPAVLKF